MRDSARIPILLQSIHDYWMQNPDWRLTQLIYNVTNTHGDIFHLEDDRIQAGLNIQQATSLLELSDLTIIDRLLRILKEEFDTSDEEADALSPGENLKDFLGLDDLDMVELAMAVEDEFGIEIPDDDITPALDTLAGLAQYVDVSIHGPRNEDEAVQEVVDAILHPVKQEVDSLTLTHVDTHLLTDVMEIVADITGLNPDWLNPHMQLGTIIKDRIADMGELADELEATFKITIYDGEWGLIDPLRSTIWDVTRLVEQKLRMQHGPDWKTEFSPEL